MRVKLAVFILVLISIFRTPAYAQCSQTEEIIIAGKTCVGSQLTATTNVEGTITWKRDGSVLTTQPASTTTNGIVVAGGNGQGSGANQFSYPNRIYVDAAGNLYVPDMNNSRIQKWAPGATAGVTIAGGNGIGSASNQFYRPTSVSIDSKGNIYVTDQYNSRIQKWAPGATSGVTVAQNLSLPTGIFIDAQDNIYVSEQNDAKVTKWVPGATTGIVVAGGHGYGSASNQLSTPTGIYVDEAGNVYICDTDNNRIQKWAPGASTGTTVAGTGVFGSAANQLANPLGVFVDKGGVIYVSDYNNYRVQQWKPGATSGITVAGGNGAGTGTNQLRQPAGIFMDASCNLYVSDVSNHRVLKYIVHGTGSYTTTAPGTYTASIQTSSGTTVVSNSIIISASKQPSISIATNATTICPGSSSTFTATATNGGNNPVYQWKKNGINTGTNSATYIDNGLVDGDKISCVVTSNEVCLSSPTATSNEVVMIVQKTVQPVQLGPDIALCEQRPVTLQAGNNYADYKWQDGSTEAVFNVTKAGTYYVTVQGKCGGSTSDTIIVAYYQPPHDFLEDRARFCTGDSVELKPSAIYKQYLWSTNAGTESIEVKTAGEYWLQVTDENNCVGKDVITVYKEDCMKRFYMPNSFTPNGDGKNDDAKPLFYDDISSLTFTIYNRWGEIVFQTKERNRGWDGRWNAVLQPSNTFIWVCTYQFRGESKKTEAGVITLIR